MNPSEYRREYRDFSFAVERARYDYDTGASGALRLDEINERYADLWRRESVTEVLRAHDETPTSFATERDALHSLAGALELGFCAAQTREILGELETCESAQRIAWRSEKITIKRALLLLKDGDGAEQQRELAARFADAIAACNDLRAELFEQRRSAARALEFENFRALYESIIRLKLESFVAAANRFLERTAPVYSSALAHWARARFTLPIARQLSYAETFVLERAAGLNSLLKVTEARSLYESAFAELGISQAVRLQESASENLRLRGATYCAIKPPEDVRVVYGTERGTESVLKLFHAVGGAQSFAWASRDLLARYPEFVYAPDEATHAAFAAFFERFFQDEMWLAAHLPVKPSEARETAAFVALRNLFEIRRACAQLQFALALEAANDPRDAQLADNFAAAHTEATNFDYPTSLSLCAARGSLEKATTQLRAQLFAVALRERLRARYEIRWWTRRAARDYLIDMWNTASRYSVEELARLNDIGELSFDLLAEDAIEALRGE